jgi:hypothetical protein
MSTFVSLTRRGFNAALAFVLAGSLLTSPAHAGTPLICHPYDIGTAESLPGSTGDWKGVNPNYNRANLVSDTLTLLAPKTPIIVRMETLRRAAIYATAGMRGWGTKAGFSDEDRANVAAITTKLRERSEHAKGADRALALFDYGFFAETLRHTNIDPSLDGYALIARALSLRGGSDPDMEFALALASSWPNRRAEHEAHLARARAGAKANSLLTANLASHFSRS